MKKLFLLVCIAGFTINGQAQQPVTVDASGAKIQFASEMIEYGIITLGADGAREFTFKNTGKEPLIITDVKSSCGCLVASGPKEPIAPGKSGVIKVYYDTKRVGRFEKAIAVNTNSDRPSITLKVKGEVVSPF